MPFAVAETIVSPGMYEVPGVIGALLAKGSSVAGIHRESGLHMDL